MKQHKTPLMMYLELRHHLSIEQLLSGPASEVAEHLKINKSTITLWRDRLGVRSTGYCLEHEQRVWDFCHQCWFESLGMDSIKAEEVAQTMNQD